MWRSECIWSTGQILLTSAVFGIRESFRLNHLADQHEFDCDLPLMIRQYVKRERERGSDVVCLSPDGQKIRKQL